jgi:hypothetical protein
VLCTGRFYDFFTVHGRLENRAPPAIYEKDRLDVVDPAATLRVEPELLERSPVGYRHLGYVRTKAGLTVKAGLPGVTGEATSRLYDEGTKWLAGSDEPGVLA